MLTAIIQLVAKADQLLVAAVLTAQQKVPNLLADRSDLALKRTPFDFSRLVLSPILKQLAMLTHQIVTHSLDLSIGGIDQLLKIAFQMSPTPLQPLAVEVHLGPVAIDDDPLIVADQSHQRLAAAIGKDTEHREHLGHGDPQPRLLPVLFGGRFIDEELLLLGQLAAKFLVRNRNRAADEVLNLDRPGGAARNVQQIAQKRRGPALALAEVAHQQPGEGGQPGTALSAGHALGQFRLRGDAAARTVAAEQLVLVDERFDLRQFPHLMAPGGESSA